MKGKFKNAPLVYVTASIRTSSLPRLTSEQAAGIEQFMVKEGLIHHKVSEIAGHEIKLRPTNNSLDSSEVTKHENSKPRHGYFSDDSLEGIIIAPNGIEWRTFNYETYQNFHKSFSSRISKIMNIAEPYQQVKVEEVTLSFVDVIVPLNGRKLADYFSGSSECLPLSLFDKMQDEPDYIYPHQIGITQVSKIASPTEKITATIEQLPTVKGKISKYVPTEMIETDPEFGQSLSIKEEWKSGIPKDAGYVLLLTQGSTLPCCELNQYRKTDLFENAHNLTDGLFQSLINFEVCKKDWQYQNRRSK